MGRFGWYMVLASVNAFLGLRRIGIGDISRERKKIEALLELIEQALRGFENRARQQRGQFLEGSSFTEIVGWDESYEVLAPAFPHDFKSQLLRIQDVLRGVLEERLIAVEILEETIRIISKAVSKLSTSFMWDDVKSGLGVGQALFICFFV